MSNKYRIRILFSQLFFFLKLQTHIGSGQGWVGVEVWYFCVIMEQVNEDRPGQQRRGEAVERGADQGEEYLLNHIIFNDYQILLKVLVITYK